MKTALLVVGGILTLGILWVVLAKFAGPGMKKLVSATPSLPSGGAAQTPPVNTSWNPLGFLPQILNPQVPGSTGAVQAAQQSNQSGDILSNLLSPAGLQAAGNLFGQIFKGGNSSMTPSSTYSTGGGIDTPALYFPDDTSSYSDYYDGTTSPFEDTGFGSWLI